MEDNSSSDDEIKDSTTNPKSGGKKLKLNDGSSQDSIKNKESSNKKDENVDSGISADKSESTSSDDRAAGTSEGPSNEVINAAPSGSNVRAILLNLRRPKCTRFYRKRKTPDRDSESSRDSDDISVEESANGSNENSVQNQRTPPFSTSRSNENSASENENEDLRRFASFAHFLRPNLDYGASDSSSSNDSTSSVAESNETYESDDIINIASIDTDSDYDVSGMSPPNNESENDENTGKPPSVLLKTRPKHSYFMLREIINREMGLKFRSGKTTKEDVMFEQRFYGSLHAVYRLKKLHSLNKHRGCVNSINFHPEGHLLASGSDDTNVVVWDWARNSVIQTIKTGHRSNVFQSKFLHLNAKSQLNIVTCARDGQVRLLQCHPAGGVPVSRRKLVTHSLAAHKLHVCASEPHLVISAGEDGLVAQSDVRTEDVTRLFQVREKGHTIPLYSVCGNPVDGKELLVAGRDRFVRLYDRRKSNKPLAMYCPAFFNDPTTNKSKKKPNMHLTCAVYNHNGTEILGSYNDEDIYLFDVKNDIYDKDNTDELKEGFTHRYSGHRNSATFKGVAFFGPRSEYIVSGSDCSYIYIWEKKTEAIVQWLKGDVKGVVNCIETHPRCPVLATSGLDKDVKIWLPRSQSDPTYEGLEKVVKNNNISQLRSPLFNDFLPTLYNVWRGGNRFFSDDDDSVPLSYGGNIEIDGNNCTTC